MVSDIITIAYAKKNFLIRLGFSISIILFLYNKITFNHQFLTRIIQPKLKAPVYKHTN